jgi:uncharacterized protein YdhG (YjbR/CyaY superfamily)
VDAVVAYLAALPEPQQGTLRAVRATLRSVLPTATEAMKYGMPAFVVCGKSVAGYAAFTEHCSYFPHSSQVLERAGTLIDAYPTSKGRLRFAVDRPLPKALIKQLVRLRLDELGEVSDGKRFELLDGGSVKAAGTMQAGEFHGAWRWYRKDGSLLRSGSFRHGQQNGTWRTYDAAGNAVTTKRY